MTVCFQKRGRYMVGFSYLLNPKAVEEGHLAIVLPNIVDLPKSSCKLNLFEAHIKSDTAVFGIAEYGRVALVRGFEKIELAAGGG